MDVTDDWNRHPQVSTCTPSTHQNETAAEAGWEELHRWGDGRARTGIKHGREGQEGLPQALE